ncbi:hypothetical protein [Chitinophaga agri]|uniref:Uncharacterized protein n=1 Tax=Chitinophaga agri TaxID=2703787 RepID=A0A6B9ZPD0_9BACT|nr:hypothetical protein [Chitinophaga agri]QHS63264.1 hypothetical protein GWR21_27865 [Chitinophaga agri]
MEKNTWIDVEREYEYRNEEWIEVKRKSIRNQGLSTKVKDIWELIFKFFAAIAIFTPFIIITVQNRSEIKLQKKKCVDGIIV